jgi:hypothetical protein
VFKENFKPENAIEYLKANFSGSWNKMEQLRQDLAKAKTEGNPKKISRLQMKIADQIAAIIYSDKFWKYKSGAYQISETAKTKQVNCMARSAIAHVVFKEFFGEETLAGVISEHFFPIVKLADNAFYSIDPFVNPRRFIAAANGKLEKTAIKRSPNSRYINNNWMVVGDHERQYRAGIWGWLIEKNNFRFAFSQSIKYCPENPDAYLVLAEKIDASDGYPEKEKEFERAVLGAVNLADNDPYSLTVAGNYYADRPGPRNFTKAIEYYQKALKIMDRNPGLENNWSIAEIEEKLQSAKKRLKKQH